MSNVTWRDWPQAKQPAGFPAPTNAALPVSQPWPRARLSASAATAAMGILQDATFYIDAMEHQRAGSHPKLVRNLGTGGAALDARCGSTSVADSNDPKFLDFTGRPYVYLPGVSGCTLTTPDSNELDVTGDIDLRFYGALDSWANGGQQFLIGKAASGTSRSYRFQVDATGTLSIYWSADGTANTVATSTASMALPAGATKWVRATLDVDNGATGRDAKFYTSDDGVTWTQLGNTVTQAGVTSIYNSTSQVIIGELPLVSAGVTAGKVYRAQVLNGINGTTVLDVDTSVITSGSATSFTAVTGQQVTINRATSGRKSVAVVAPVWLFGTDDRIDVLRHNMLEMTNNDSFSWFIVARQWSTSGGGGTLMSKRGGNATVGYDMTRFATTNSARLSDGVTALSNDVTAAAGALMMTGGFVSRQRLQTAANNNGALSTIKSLAGVGSLVNTFVLRIGDWGSGGNPTDMECVAALVFRRDLTVSEIATLTTHFQTRWP